MTTLMKRIFGILLSFFFAVPAFSADVIHWQGPEGMASNANYTLFINGEEIEVYEMEVASYAIFDFTGEVEITVETRFDVRWVDVRPSRHQVEVEYLDAHTFRFRINEPKDLSVELNGEIRNKPLFLFTNYPETEIPDRNNPDVIWFEQGKFYDEVALELKSGQTVYIEGGAVVRGNILGKDVENVRITGRGMMDGSLNSERRQDHRQFIDFRDSRELLIEGITLVNSTTWQVVPTHCENVHIRDLHILSEDGGDDGMDIVRSKNVLIERVFAHTKDDCIAIKSHRDYPASEITDNIIVRDCVFWNSIWGNAIEIGFELYSEEVRNIRFQNIDIIHVEDGAALSIHNAGPARVHSVIFEDIRIEDARQKLIDVAIFFSKWGPDGIRDEEWVAENYMHGAWDGVQYVPDGKEEYHRQFRGYIDGIIFRNIHVTGGMLPFSVFHGYDKERNVSNILIQNLVYVNTPLKSPAEAKIRMENTNGLVIE